MKCDEIYRAVLSSSDLGDDSLFDLAQCFLDGYDPEKLRAMLESQDNGIVSDALFILGEVGEIAKNYLLEIKTLTQSADSEVGRKARELASVYDKSCVWDPPGAPSGVMKLTGSGNDGE